MAFLPVRYRRRLLTSLCRSDLDLRFLEVEKWRACDGVQCKLQPARSPHFKSTNALDFIILPASGMLLEDLLIENCLQSRDIWGGGNFDF